ncbi:MAG: hypothetical protein WBM50_07260 [Acidimicrobiales bacterium]
MTFRVAVMVPVALLLLSACTTDLSTPPGIDAAYGADDVYESIDGQQIVVVNGSPDAIRLLDWAFGRFLESNLGEPPTERIYFGPDTPGCASVSGWAKQTESSVEIAICLADASVCNEGLAAGLTNRAKFCALHELAHAWLIANVDTETEAAFLAHTNLVTWVSTGETPWHKRGVEYAAEVIAWALMDTRLSLVRIASPPCRHLEVGFDILTGATPLLPCGPEESLGPVAERTT